MNAHDPSFSEKCFHSEVLPIVYYNLFTFRVFFFLATMY